MATQVLTENGLRRALSDAQLELAKDLIGVSFREPGKGGWLKIVGVVGAVVYIESADDPGEWFAVIGNEVRGLLNNVILALGGPSYNGWTTKDGRAIMNWPMLVSSSGWTVEQMREKGVAWSRLNPRSGAETFLAR